MSAGWRLSGRLPENSALPAWRRRDTTWSGSSLNRPRRNPFSVIGTAMGSAPGRLLLFRLPHRTGGDMTQRNGNGAMPVLALEMDRMGQVTKKMVRFDHEGQLENTLVQALYPELRVAT